MKLSNKVRNTLRAKHKAAIKNLTDPVRKYVNNPPHDSLLAPSKVFKRPDTPCTALTTTKGAVVAQNQTLANPSEALVPVSESPAQSLEKKRARFAGKHLPVVHCNTCKHTQVCQYYKAGYECQYIGSFLKKIQSVEDVPEVMRNMVEAEMGRIQQALVFEQLSGGGVSEEVTLALDSAFGKLAKLYEMHKAYSTPSAAQSSGLIEKLFGSILPKTVEVEVKPLEVKDDNKSSTGGRSNP